MLGTLYVVESRIPKRPSFPLDFKLSPGNPDDQLQLPHKVPDQMTKGTRWNTWIMSCGVVAVSAVVLLLEHHIRGLHSILYK
jgi:hypothetical protein